MSFAGHTLRAQRAVGEVLAAVDLDEIPIDGAGGAEVLHLGRGIIDPQAADAEPPRRGIVRCNAALDFDLDFARFRSFEPSRARETIRTHESVDLDSIAARQAGDGTSADGIIERRVVVGTHALTGHDHDALRGVDGLDRALQQAPHLDALRAPAAVVVDLGLEAHDLADLEFGEGARTILDAHTCAGRVVAHAIDDDAAETGDRT